MTRLLLFVLVVTFVGSVGNPNVDCCHNDKRVGQHALYIVATEPVNGKPTEAVFAPVRHWERDGGVGGWTCLYQEPDKTTSIPLTLKPRKGDAYYRVYRASGSGESCHNSIPFNDFCSIGIVPISLHYATDTGVLVNGTNSEMPDCLNSPYWEK